MQLEIGKTEVSGSVVQMLNHKLRLMSRQDAQSSVCWGGGGTETTIANILFSLGMLLKPQFFLGKVYMNFSPNGLARNFPFSVLECCL